MSSRVRSATTTALLAAQLVTTLAMLGVCWTVQLAVYPQLALIGSGEFATWHASYTGGIALVVGPLMVVEALSAAALVWLPPAGIPRFAPRLGLALVGVVLASTALIQAPLHARLAGGFSQDLYRLLVASNWLRTATWSLRGALVTWMALRAAAPGRPAPVSGAPPPAEETG
jgi:hypothetical protein